MPKFYFTYGTDPSYPFQGGWTEIEAPDRPSACTIFKIYHPNREGSAERLNCAGIYDEEEFRRTQMAEKGNFNARCREGIALGREVMGAGRGDS